MQSGSAGHPFGAEGKDILDAQESEESRGGWEHEAHPPGTEGSKREQGKRGARKEHMCMARPHPQGAIRDHLLSRQGACRDHLLIGRAAGPAEAEADQPARAGPYSSVSGGAAADTRKGGTEPGGHRWRER